MISINISYCTFDESCLKDGTLPDLTLHLKLMVHLKPLDHMKLAHARRLVKGLSHDLSHDLVEGLS